MSTIKVHNTLNMSVELEAADGDSVTVMPRSKVEVNSKFDWRLPKGVLKIINKQVSSSSE